MKNDGKTAELTHGGAFSLRFVIGAFKVMNHETYFKSMNATGGGTPERNETMQWINKSFGSYDKFREVS